MCEELAQYYNTLWCPEFAREYLLTNGKNYDFEDLSLIAKGQLAMEDEYASMVNGLWTMIEDNMYINQQSQEAIRHEPLLFIDTDMYVIKVWSEYVFNKCDSVVLSEIANRKYDLYLLCNIDLPWAKDDLREYPDEGPRQELYKIYKDILINQHTPWAEISGTDNERLYKAIEAIKRII